MVGSLGDGWKSRVSRDNVERYIGEMRGWLGAPKKYSPINGCVAQIFCDALESGIVNFDRGNSELGKYGDSITNVWLGSDVGIEELAPRREQSEKTVFGKLGVLRGVFLVARSMV
jgi:hypothetical protein